MELVAILWLVVLLALAIMGVVVVRRMSAMLNRTRSLERFQASVESISLRFGTAAGPLVRGLDEARRHAGDPTALTASLANAQTVLEALHVELQQLDAPTAAAAAVTGMRGELDRALRAASLIEHGLGAMQGTSMGRDLEAQTSLKRGALNLRHAHDAFTLHAREVADLRPADLITDSARSTSRAQRLPDTSQGAYGGGEATEVDRGSDHRM